MAKRAKKKAGKKTSCKKTGANGAGPKQAGEKATRKRPAPTAPKPTAKGRLHFPVVGIGASAGGLDALQTFFKHLSPDSGMAYIVVSHLDPQRVSLMPQLLQSCTSVPVTQVEDGTRLAGNRVYVIPPNKDLALVDGVLRLEAPVEHRGARLAIDHFFCSLAADQGENAVSIVLSGAGSDGTMGLREIHRQGGAVMVQAPETAQYDSMPLSAIATNLVDFILSPAEMPDKLRAYAECPGHCTAQGVGLSPEVSASALRKIFSLLRTHTTHDFSMYKKNTICRRIDRRMCVHQFETIDHYVRYLQEDPEEVQILFKELLIGVTSFFRDPEAFGALRQALLKSLAEKTSGYIFRVWVPGCATGEEAYSTAILLHECMTELNQHISVQIFATDIDEAAIDLARAGLFSNAVVSTLGAERIKRYFAKENGAYRIKNDIRSMLTFAPQNVIKDPPFTKLDLLCCRNLLIYLDGESQKLLLPLFHYSLRPKGILFLGTSESVGNAVDLFEALDSKQKVFQRRKSSQANHAIMKFPIRPSPAEPQAPVSPPPGGESKGGERFRQVERCLLDKYAPSCVVVDEKGEIVYIVRGHTARYLDLAHGEARMNVLEMSKRPLRNKLSAALHKASNSRQCVSYRGLRIQEDDHVHVFNLHVEPLLEPEALSGLLIVVFEHSQGPDEPLPAAASAPPPKKASSRITLLEQELRSTKEDLQTTIEMMESANEELKSNNEELQSTNEELQSSNEELETSKEEMHSLNEELATVNAENQARINELSRAHDDMRNLLDSTPFATIFVDSHLRVRRFTPKAAKIINLIEADIGRPITHIVSNLAEERLFEEVEAVLETLIPVEANVQTKEGEWYSMRLAPYRTVNNVIDGVVMTFDSITDRVQAQKSLRKSEALLYALLAQTPYRTLLVDRKGVIDFANCDFKGIAPENLVGSILLDHLAPKDRAALQKVMQSDPQVDKCHDLILTLAPEAGEEAGWAVHLEPLLVDGEVVGHLIRSQDLDELK